MFRLQLMEDPEAALGRNSWFVCGRDGRLLAGGRWNLQPRPDNDVAITVLFGRNGRQK